MSIVVSSLGSVITVADIIKAGYRLLQVSSPDTALTEGEIQDGLQAFNMMIDGMSNESLMLHHISKETFQTVAGQASYTIGYSGNFNTARPINIEAMTVNISGTDWPVKQLAYDDYAAIRLKTLNSNYAQYFYVDEGADFSTIYIYPVPVNTAPTITLYMRKPLPTFTSAYEEIILPKGYLRMFKYNFAVEVAPEYQTDPGEVVRRIAITSKADLKRTNVRSITTQTDLVPLSSTRPRYNIYSDR